MTSHIINAKKQEKPTRMKRARFDVKADLGRVTGRTIQRAFWEAIVDYNSTEQRQIASPSGEVAVDMELTIAPAQQSRNQSIGRGMGGKGIETNDQLILPLPTIRQPLS
jgi:hypothetical protein